jgi:hypothetical protein
MNGLAMFMITLLAVHGMKSEMLRKPEMSTFLQLNEEASFGEAEMEEVAPMLIEMEQDRNAGKETPTYLGNY